MKLKVGSWICLSLAILLLCVGAVVPFVILQNTSSDVNLGIIGGAGTPTYSLLLFRYSNGLFFPVLLWGMAFLLTSVFCLIFSNTVKTYGSVRTSMLSVGLSATGAAGLDCFLLWMTIVAFDELNQHPIAYPASILFGFLCLAAFGVLLVLYARFRTLQRSLKGVLMDVATSFVYLPAFLTSFGVLYEMIS